MNGVAVTLSFFILFFNTLLPTYSRVKILNFCANNVLKASYEESKKFSNRYMSCLCISLLYL